MTHWFRARALSTVVGVAVLAGAVCGPVALYLVMTDTDPAIQTQLDIPDGRTGVAGEFASLFVASWLRGDDLQTFNPALASTDSGLLVERVGAVRTTERGQGMFDVVVAADLVEFVSGSEEQFRPIGLRYYAVGVAAAESGDLTVLGLPAVVEAPLTGPQPTPAISDMRRAADPEMAGLTETLDGFFAAYLAGVGDVGLFTSPNSIVGAVNPAPFGQAQVSEIGWDAVPGVDDPSIRLVRAVVDAGSAAGQQRLEYSIVVAERDGRWEISQVLHAPVVFLGESR